MYILAFTVLLVLIYLDIKAGVELWQSDLPFWLKMKLWEG